MNVCFIRIYQKLLKLGSMFLGIKSPPVIDGEDKYDVACSVIKEKGLKKPLIVTGEKVFARGLTTAFCEALKNNGFEYSVYNHVMPNPTVANAEEGFSQYVSEQCDFIIAIGGGSPLDCAKAIGVMSVGNNLRSMRRLLGVKGKMPFLIAVPTTAGSGSETTLAAVITDEQKKHKYALSDPKLIPSLVVFDSELTKSMPSSVTAQTGMDALTHAIEAYIGRANTTKTKKCASEAVKLIFENLPIACEEGKNIKARDNMLRASYLAGVAFTRAYVGYVHASAHALGGAYDTPHGLANAVLLPRTLEMYGESAYKPLASLAKAIGLSGNRKQLAQAFIKKIYELNERIGIPKTLKIKASDITSLAHTAYKEGVPLYPTPRIFSEKEFVQLYCLVADKSELK